MSQEQEKSQQEAGAVKANPPRRRNPHILKSLGVTESDLDNPLKAMFEGGAQRLWAVLKALDAPFMEDRPVIQKTGDAEIDEAREFYAEREREERERQLAEERLKRPAVWRQLSGLFKQEEDNLSPEKRQECAQRLIDIVVQLLRNELKLERENPNPYHTIQWDPVRKICVLLGIAPSHLSKLSKEATGLAAHELLDGIHAETIRAKMREQLRAWLASRGSASKSDGATARKGGGDAPVPGRVAPTREVNTSSRIESTSHPDRSVGATSDEDAAELYAELKRSRRGPHFHRSTWALAYGFPNFMRFYRACRFYYKLTPQELEFALLQELLAEDPNACSDESSAMAMDSESAPVNRLAGWAGGHRLPEPAIDVARQQHVHFFTELGARLFAMRN
ncbi:MAG TPA: hypothetical protein VEK08_01035 [Planctomycetota bacterium]|nr:hypothetical protein [Planctomycetota bacterium]